MYLGIPRRDYRYPYVRSVLLFTDTSYLPYRPSKVIAFERIRKSIRMNRRPRDSMFPLKIERGANPDYRGATARGNLLIRIHPIRVLRHIDSR